MAATTMMDAPHFQLEATGTAATLYITGVITRSTANMILRCCHGLPAGVRNLSINIDVRDQVDDWSQTLLDWLRMYWMTNRGAGSLRVTFPWTGRTSRGAAALVISADSIPERVLV